MRLLPLLLLMAVAPASAQLRLPLVLSDGAVLQRDRPIPVWGWTAPHATVSVVLGDQSRLAESDREGRWRVVFPALEAGGPYRLSATSGQDEVHARDLVVGDVWVLSGQSNMEWMVRDSDDAHAEIAAAGDDRIRHFKVPRSSATEPQDELAGGAWHAESPETVGDFSAVGTFFAREIRARHDVPIGLVNTTWGGSRIEPWMSASMLGLSADELTALEDQERARMDTFRALVGDLPDVDLSMDGDEPLWAGDLEDGDWAAIRVPELWETQGYDVLDGVAWYRTTVELSTEDIAHDLTLGLGMIDDDDVTYVNGLEVGRMANGWNRERRYTVPASVLREGENVIAVRVADHGLGGGIGGSDDLVYLEAADGTRRSLAGDWRFKVALVQLSSSTSATQTPMVLWNQMVAPLTGFPIAGVLWYQGEANGGSVEDARAYSGQFQSMIEGWREAWRQPDLPFYWVQLAAFRAPPSHANDTGIWPTVRESQSSALALDHTAEALALDVGEADDIHPRDKQTVGYRLALAARRAVYGE
ncbi:sialate O-acetylesterase, partial [Rubrivirga sp.]|uniref:sialate O-acetylesterase n=1 Tax=Rubrivirga sp. TaxID=1885344 RepID=UPI003C793A8F